VTPANLSIYGTALDDKGDLFVAQVNGPILSAPGPFPQPASTRRRRRSPIRHRRLFARRRRLLQPHRGGANGTIYILGTTGQPGGGYGQVTPIVNSSSP